MRHKLRQDRNQMAKTSPEQPASRQYWLSLLQAGQLLTCIEELSKMPGIQQQIDKGKNNINTAPTLNNIGLVYEKQGLYEEALQHYKVNGKDKINTIILNNIGNLHNIIENYQLALENFKKCLQIQKKVKGQGSIDTASLLKNIGLVYDNQARYPLALKSYMDCLQIEQKIKGANSIDAASTFNNIGMVYFKQENFKQALKNCKNVWRQSNIDTASTLNNIGLIYNQLGNYQQAKRYYEQAFAIYRNVNFQWLDGFMSDEKS